MSPSFKTRFFDGMPCTTSLLIEVQSTQGNPWYPLKAGLAPSSLMRASATFSRSSVVAPGLTWLRTNSSTSRTTLPARRIFSIS
jgi:hypothetical protein